MTSVLISIDTELSPRAHERGMSASENFSRAVLGSVPDGEWGIRYQIDRFRQHGLRAVFLVEALSASVVGMDMLKRTVDPILSAGHEVQLHLHTEWLTWLPQNIVGAQRGKFISDFSYEHQCRLIELGIKNLTMAGTPPPVAFRAGNYGANNDTLRALATLGIAYDTSYSFPYIPKACKILVDRQLLDPAKLDGVIEVPITAFNDYADHSRPVEICAISTSEMRGVLAQSIRQQRRTLTIVGHSFELLNRARTKRNALIAQRFESLCEMLGEAGPRGKTRGFAELKQDELVVHSPGVGKIESAIWRTASRFVEQAVGNIRYH